jgi:Pentapeptide repeats (8 copies)
MADFTSAGLQGANLSLASLEGAVLRDAELEGASMRMASLQGADMTGAKLQGSDLASAHVWRTTPPSGEAAFSDMAQILVRPPSEDELAALGASLASMEDGRLKARLADSLLALTDPSQNAGWATSPDQQLWQGLARSSGDAAAAEGYKGRLTDYLTKLMCRSRNASGAVAAGVARRAMAQGFKGDMPALYDKLRSPDCPASAAISPRVMRDFATAVDAARGQ